ncbi:uncharacterized protein LOC106639107 [Copidosoma floridanum]|uniref:uncharacterized protein LOC106639107 n=1 Tax=Copidosoma floridanum TaxID=29053 RepID=UPI0006C9A335|nr:uncharacterized protein LOC106639107 [Copidosoma floridanum]
MFLQIYIVVAFLGAFKVVNSITSENEYLANIKLENDLRKTYDDVYGEIDDIATKAQNRNCRNHNNQIKQLRVILGKLKYQIELLELKKNSVGTTPKEKILGQKYDSKRSKLLKMSKIDCKNMPFSAQEEVAVAELSDKLAVLKKKINEIMYKNMEYKY